MADPHRRARDRRRIVLQDGLLACYEIIDRIRKELAELDAADKAGIPMDPQHLRDKAARGVPGTEAKGERDGKDA